MNIEDYREYCLSLGEDIEEKLPFQKFFAKQSGKAERKNGEGVLGYPPRDSQSRGFLPSMLWATCSLSSIAMISPLSR